MRESFCPACGGVLMPEPWEDGLTLPVCAVCGCRCYANSKPCVVAVAIDRAARKILLTRRGVEPFKDCWDLPGGFLRNGEDPVDGIRREVREELGVDCIVDRQLAILVDTYGAEDVFTFNVCYLVQLQPGPLQAMDDVAETAWFDIDAIPANLAFTFLGDIIAKAVREVFGPE